MSKGKNMMATASLEMCDIAARQVKTERIENDQQKKIKK